MNQANESDTVSLTEIAAAFASALDGKSSIGHWQPDDSDPGIIPEFTLDEQMAHLIFLLYKKDWILDFDWSAWAEQNPQFSNSTAAVAAASLDQIKKLLTRIVRGERFCSGTILAAFQSGHLHAISKRLRNICSDDNPSTSISR